MKNSEIILSMYEDGYSQKDINSIHNIPLSDIQKTLKENGVDTNYRSLDNDIKDYIIYLSYNGLNISKIADILDLSRYTVRDICNKNITKKQRNEYKKNIIIKKYKEGTDIKTLYLSFKRFGKKNIINLLKSENIYNNEVENEIIKLYQKGIKIYRISILKNISFFKVKKILKGVDLI